ncbi:MULTISPECIES: NAD(P)H-hydrate epimerase [unclassified Helicobacter]|uniref:NAD(P)H-hydrate epimerase n=1 Tax=unclassified Helicobacter TaxID=2593540 RepID=UPI000CF08578|nr:MULTISPECIES: NAD(P)H-hydrate epimerase [unclassified Helicobacter]
MLEVYRDNKALDSRCITQFDLSEEILMENAGIALKDLIKKVTHKGSVISIVCGGGNNGADGYVLARQLSGDYKVRILVAKEPKSPLCIKQYHRAMAVGVECVKKLLPCDVVVDCLIGSGMQSRLDEKMQKIIAMMQGVGRIKIACDIPSGIDSNGVIKDCAFCADYTVAMGGISLALLSDFAKDYVGEIIIGDLGVSRQKYSLPSQIKLLQKEDYNPPIRKKQASHKGDFGHLSVYAGERGGAGNLCGMAGLSFGVGSVSIVGNLHPYFAELMYEKEVSSKTTAFCIGMGMLGSQEDSKDLTRSASLPKEFLDLPKQIPCVLDADILKNQEIIEILQSYENLVITPHYGEFLCLWELAFDEVLPKQKFLENKFDYLMQWGERFPKVVTLLKGANVVIAQKNKVFINPFGNVALAKAGSGDVLAGLIGALLAQGKTPLESALQGSLSHSFGAQSFKEKNFALRPLELLQEIKGA